jgi:hypothetical protein
MSPSNCANNGKNDISLRGSPLLQNDYDALLRSWINSELADSCLLRRVTALEGSEIIGHLNSKNCAGIVFPYIWPGEHWVREYRLRRDTPDVEYKDGKPRSVGKYLSPPGRSNLLYFVPRTCAAWLEDSSLPVVITEGEKKTIALWRLAYHQISEVAELPRFLPVGLAGVWNWRGTIGKETGPNGDRVKVKGVIPDFGRIEWVGRRVVLLLDSNVRSDLNLSKARRELARHLVERGAQVFIVDIPVQDNVNGIDDLLAIEGPEKALALIEHANKSRIKPPQLTQSERFINLCSGAELFRTHDQRFYATLPILDHHETWPIRSHRFRGWLARNYYVQHQKPASTQALQDALQLCEAQAQFDGPIHDVGLRVLRGQNAIHLDLANPRWSDVLITASGWRVEAAASVKFRRSRGMAELPVPVTGGTLQDLRPFINSDDNATWILIISWLIGSFNPVGPYPILILQGEQGSSKSTTARVIRSLIDPAQPALRSSPRDERDMMIAASNSWVLSYDNLSGTQQWISDALCRLSTGGGFATRELHSDNEETLFEATRPIILNGIDDIATNPDLADRALIVTLPAIPEEKRKTERQFWQGFEKCRPGIIGALLDAVSTALKNADTIALRKTPRMADFAEWVCSAAESLPFTAEQFLTAYFQNRTNSILLSIETSPVATAIEKLLLNESARSGECPCWSGTASQLLEKMNSFTSEEDRRSRNWPKDVRILGNRLRRVATPLRSAGIDIAFTTEGHNNKRIISLRFSKFYEEEDARNARNRAFAAQTE